MIKSGRVRVQGMLHAPGRTAYRILVGKPKESLGGCKHRWEDNIKMDLTEIGWDGTEFIWFRTGTIEWLV
jgi:hypothetical protein